MKQFKGTPGPWLKEVRSNRRGNSTILAIIPKRFGERVIETVLQTGVIHDDDCGVETCCCVEEHANARLIAAAPDLLEALDTINNWLVCSAIASPEDMAQSFEEMQQLCEKSINKALNI